MKQYILLILQLICIVSAFAINYYTIFGNDNNNTYGAEDYAITYDQIINGKLSNIYTKEMNGNEVFYLRYLQEIDTIVMINRIANSSLFAITTYNISTNNEKSIDVTSGFSFSKVYIDNKNPLHLIIECVTNNGLYYYDYDISNNSIIESQNYDISNFDFLLYGMPYIKSYNPDCLFGLYLDNKLIYESFRKDWIINISIPKDLVQIDYTKRINWGINNKDLSTYLVNISDKHTSIDNDILILDKKQNRYIYKAFSDNYINLKSSNGWLISEKSFFLDETESPGKAERDAIVSQFGEFKWAMFDHRGKSYYPGTLMLYHPVTDRTIYIETNQGDSEILLVQNDYVYYRVLDKIFKAKIKGNTLGTSVKIAQDPKIAEVHWLIVEGEEE